MSALSLSRPIASKRRPAADLPRAVRTFLAVGAGVVTVPIVAALARTLTGVTPGAAALKEVALAIHLASVIPAIPLGAWVLLNRKGTPRHRMLGKVWLAMMIVAALSAMAIRHLNNGSLSLIHLLVPVVLIGSWRAVATARAGNIVAHRRGLLLLFVGALLIPALTAFVPGRLMWTWLLG